VLLQVLDAPEASFDNGATNVAASFAQIMLSSLRGGATCSCVRVASAAAARESRTGDRGRSRRSGRGTAGSCRGRGGRSSTIRPGSTAASFQRRHRARASTRDPTEASDARRVRRCSPQSAFKPGADIRKRAGVRTYSLSVMPRSAVNPDRESTPRTRTCSAGAKPRSTRPPP